MVKEIEAKIKEIIPRTNNVKSVRLGLEGASDYRAGQFLCVWLKADTELKRYLSISSSPTEEGYIEFTKKITESEFSKALNRLKVGDPVKVQYPFGKFVLDDTYTKVAFISGGIGITPIRSICKFAVDKNIGTDIMLIYANRTLDDIAFREDFNQMQKQYQKLRVIHVLSEPSEGFLSRAGMVNNQIIKEEIPDYRERRFYLCGPPAMVETMKKILRAELVVREADIVTENFTGY